MKFLLTSFWRLPDVGGVWTYTAMLRTGLERLGHQVDILTRHPERLGYYLIGTDRFLPKAALWDIVRGHLLADKSKQWPRLRYDAPFDRNGMTLLDMETERYCFELAAGYFGFDSYDLIHAQDIISARAISRVKHPSTPLVTTMHGLLTQELVQSGGFAHGSPSWLYSMAQEQCGLLSSDRIVTPTRWMRDLCLETFQVPADQLHVVPYGMDLDEFLKKSKIPSALQALSEHFLIVCPARLDRLKGQQFLLPALARLKESRSDWQCWLIGDGYMQADFQQQRDALGLQDHVLLLGMRDDVPALLQQADLVVLPSLQDNHPYALMEAQAAGKTVLASAIGGIPEMIRHEETGLLLPAGDSDALYRSLVRTLADANLLQALGENAHRHAQAQWSMEAMVQRTLAVYHQFFQEEGKVSA